MEPKRTADAVLGPPPASAASVTTDGLVVVGASTGGTEAVREVLAALPADAPGTVVVQHMPEPFTAAYAARLDQLVGMEVREAVDGDRVRRGLALIAPGDRHVMVERLGVGYQVRVAEGPLVCRHRPSVDVLFRSAATHAGTNAVGVLMTGMGDDGAQGLLELRQAGASTIAQDEATSAVWGMPAEAVRLGAAEAVLPLDAIAAALTARDAARRR